MDSLSFAVFCRKATLYNIYSKNKMGSPMNILVYTWRYCYALVGGALEAYGRHHVCVCLYVRMSFMCISLQQLKTKR